MPDNSVEPPCRRERIKPDDWASVSFCVHQNVNDRIAHLTACRRFARALFQGIRDALQRASPRERPIEMFSALIKLETNAQRDAWSHKTMSGVLRSIATRQPRAALRSDLNFSKEEEEDRRDLNRGFPD